MNGKKRCVVPDILLIDRVEIAFAKGQVMNGIQEIGLSCPVQADEAIDLIRKVKFGLRIILEIGDI
jgi:hypothetical protein